MKGSIGIGQGKSKQVPDAIKKATEVAKEIYKNSIKRGRTLHHDVKGKWIKKRLKCPQNWNNSRWWIRSVCEVLEFKTLNHLVQQILITY